MKKTRGRRWPALLLTLAMCLTLAPAAWADDAYSVTITNPTGALTLRKGSTQDLTVVTTPANQQVAWRSTDDKIATVDNFNNRLTALAAGEAYVYAYLENNTTVESDPLRVIVSGIAVPDSLEIYENETIDLRALAVDEGWCKGEARGTTLTVTGGDTATVELVGDHSITGLREGETTVELRCNQGDYTQSLAVTVKPDPNTVVDGGSVTTDDKLSFKTLNFPGRLGDSAVSYVTGLYVPTDRGTLYYDYRSESDPGAGVGQSQSYYLSSSPGQRLLEDVTFVPKPNYLGGEVTITYTAITERGRQYSCKIELTVQNVSGSDSQAGGISINTSYGVAVQFDSVEFGTVCRESLGVQLDHVVFAQPPAVQGTLYTNYSDPGSYGGVVDIHRQYSRRELDDVWLVPAPGFNGTVIVYYTGFGTNGESYSAQVLVTVGREDSVATGGLGYTVSPGGVVRFDDDDFDDYCKTILDDEDQLISGIRFESLPGERDGVLYYDYRSPTNTGSRAAVGTVYYSGTRTPRIDRLVFVPAEDFIGVLKLPFTGWTTDGTSFGGNVEINIPSGAVSGDIDYSCAPGKSVSFVRSDFTSLCTEATGSTLNYIRFLSLPDTAEGTLRYNSSAASTGTNYTSGNLSRLSFRASSRFTGPVNIPFEGYSRYGDRFTGVVTIWLSGTGSGTGISGNIRYTTDPKTAAVFDRDDFDDLSQWETDRDISSIRISSSDLPSSSQGSLYQNYRSSSSMGTRLTSSTTITASNLDRLAFVPASGYTGTVYIDFTGTATGSGGTFYGTVEVEVGQPAADVTAQYSTRTAPVRFYSGDLARSGSSLSSIQFTSLPSSSTGYLYAQYTSPVRYGQRASTGISYRTSGSNLISDLAFVPRAGYTGTVTIPYTGTNSSGTTFAGEIIITVSPSYGSIYFSDMASYNNSQRAAVDFLYDYGITRGIGNGQYGPENSIRRGDFALMLYQAFEFSPVSGETFADVSPGAYYAEAVNTLYARGIVSGVGNGNYAPDSPLTRQDAVCMVQRAMQAVGWSASDGYASAISGYSDSGSVSGYAQGAMALAVQRGYLPTTGGRLNPQQSLTRVDMAEILHRVLTY